MDNSGSCGDLPCDLYVQWLSHRRCNRSFQAGSVSGCNTVFSLSLVHVAFICSLRYERKVLSQWSFRQGVSENQDKKLLIPSTIGLFVFWWILGYYNMMIAGAFESMWTVPKPILFIIMAVSGTGVLWYIQMLWVFSLFLILIRRIEKDRLYKVCKKVNLPILLCMTPIVWGAAQILNTPMIVVYRFGIYGLGFLLGYSIFSHDAVMERMEKWWLPLSALALGLGIVFVSIFWGEPYAEHQVLDTFLCNAYAWIATLAILSGMKKWGNFENDFSCFMNRKAWGLYLFHYFILAASAWYLHLYTHLSPFPMYLLVGVAAFSGALIMYEIISRIPVLRFLVCGIGGGK